VRVTSALFFSLALGLPALAAAEGSEATFPTSVPGIMLSADAGADALPDGVLSARPWHLDFRPAAVDAAPANALAFAADAAAAAGADEDAGPGSAQRRPVAVTYSDAYAVRAKIHKYASIATLPLFGAEYLLGQKLYDFSASETVRAAHAGIATTLAGLFGVNTVTGVWNLWEGRKDPSHRKRRFLHSFMMLGADAGFLATGMLAPDNEGEGNRSLHRTVAITSMGVATASYLIMLLGS
jgi:hypothetical protein